MKRYTAAIVGCGSIGNAHMEGYNLVDEVEVVAVADPVPMARKTYVDAYGIPQEFETVEEMMEKARPDIVSVCTWHLLHPAPTIAAAAGRCPRRHLRKAHGHRHGRGRLHGRCLRGARHPTGH